MTRLLARVNAPVSASEDGQGVGGTVLARKRRCVRCQDEALLGRLTHMVVETVLTFYAARAAQEGGFGAKSGAVTVVQRTSSDLRLNPHLHMIVLDGTWRERAANSPGRGSGTLEPAMWARCSIATLRRMERHLRRCGLLRTLRTRPSRGAKATPKATSPLLRSRARRPLPGPSG